jgi:hypothetical protein
MTGRCAAVFALLTACLLAVSTAEAQADRGAYTIRSFDTTLTVEATSDVIVEERIEVVFSEPRHGIYRTIPVRYADPKGFGYSLGLRLLGVTDGNGRRQTTEVTNEGRYVRIRIGDPDRTVEGPVVYVLRYRVRDALVSFAEHDEIYWNATGHEWHATIARASATVRLPGVPPATDLQAAGYTGAFGSRERAVAVSHPAPGVVHFATTGPLGPLEGLTVAVGFPQGLVDFPAAAVRARRLVADNWILLLPLGWAAFLLGRYRQHGRDPDPGAPVMVTYEPPPGLTPGSVGTLVDERVDLVDITSTVVDLAVRRYLTIRTETQRRLLGLLAREETIFSRGPVTGTAGLTPYEQRVLAGLFSSGDEIALSDLKNKFYTHLPGIRKAVYDRLVENGYFDASPEATRHRWVRLGIGAGVVTGLAGYAWMTYRGMMPPADVIVPAAAGALTWLLFWVFSPAMPRRTDKGAHARQWALGFQEFARRVDGDRLERAAADPRHAFETLLPYAMALGVAGEWARKFEGIYEQKGPDWYVGQSTARGGFSTRSLEQNLSSAMSRAGQNMAASPRSSSGSGGGGYSGGGGGGGGGGSW